MIVFASKRFPARGQYGADQDRLEKLMMATRAPHDLMMLAHAPDDDDFEDIYIGVPDIGMLRGFQGYAEVSRESLPKGLAALIVREDGFADRYPDIAAKRGVGP